jgi:hypothetical protein
MDENYNLDIFEMMARTSEPTKEQIRKKLLVYKCYQMVSKISNVFFNGKISMKLCFLLLDFWHVKS